ncbi:conjugative transfer relaxase/helicase TraI [Ewingella americana]|uniref:conjugative transfer relaxase/helicase TraI n=1 Tax=Ewingella americana TaxID=41202 RepID=UPI0012AE91D7|nr:conjugative transfer relaxase/helicase TraI [Ewingella americana]MRT06037.1 conjugative transfer relaxase/helicase TraI [Ewingella americana]
MMSIATVKSAGSAGNYYTDKDNYYVIGSMGERWAGKGAEELGLSGSVDQKVFTRILEGRLPDGSDLSRKQDGGNKHRPGYDLTFSAPKSVSVMSMLGGDTRLIEAHNRSVDIAIKQVETMASTRVMVDGKSETRLTGNLVMALFNHDTSRDQEPQLHTHTVVANVTKYGDDWRTLSSDKVRKTGFIENIYANQIAFGKIYRAALHKEVTALGYETEVVGKHGMWELKDVPVEPFSSRRKAIQAAVGEDASLKSHDVAALDTRKSKEKIDPEQRMTEWMQTLKHTGFDIRAYRTDADQRALKGDIPAATPEVVDIGAVVGEAIGMLSDRRARFTFSELLTTTIGRLPAQPGVIEQARGGIDAAIKSEQLIPLDKEKGLFTSNIHVLDELSVSAMTRDLQREGHVNTFPEKGVPRSGTYGDAVSALAQDRPPIAIITGQGGAAGQRDRVAELTMMAREQGRDVQIITAEKRSVRNLAQDQRLSAEHITDKRGLTEGMTFMPGSTLIVDQGEKLTLKETLTLLDGALRHNVQLLIADSGQRTGTGSALTVMKEAGVNTFSWQGGEKTRVMVISEPDRRQRYDRLAADFAQSVSAGEHSVAQVTGPREQAILASAVRDALKAEQLLGEREISITTLEPVWLDSRHQQVRTHYREGMVMERWNAQERSRERFVIDRVTARNNSLTLRNEQGESKVARLSEFDSSWSLFRTGTLQVAKGDRLAVLGQTPGKRLKGGDTVTVKALEDKGLVVSLSGRKAEVVLPSGDSPFNALKVGQGWVEGPGHTVSDSAKVFASLAQRELDNTTLNKLALSGPQVQLYSAQTEQKTTEKLSRQPAFSVVSAQIKDASGRENLDDALAYQKAALHTPEQQAIHLAIPPLEGKGLAFTKPQLMAAANDFAQGEISLQATEREIDRQVRSGALLSVQVSQDNGLQLLVSRQSYNAEKSIIRHVLEGKNAVAPLMHRVSGTLMDGLTCGQRNATRMILESSDRFTLVQGYAGVGKTTQFRAVMSAIGTLPSEQQPRVIGVAPTHRAVSEMRDAGVPETQTLAAFIHDTQQQIRGGEKTDFSNVLFLVDESSMVGNADMAKAYSLIAGGGGRAVSSGDTDQLQSIAPGQPFRLLQKRSAIDMTVMQEIVRQTPELRPAVYSLIDRDVTSALTTIESVAPMQVPRKPDAWRPESSVMDFSRDRELAIGKAVEAGDMKPGEQPATLLEAIVRDYAGRTAQAQAQTIIITALNADRREVNAMIHETRKEAGELGENEARLPVLTPANIRDGELRRMETWQESRDNIVLLDNTYFRISELNKPAHLVTLADAQGNIRQLSPAQAVTEGVTLYRQDTITVSAGDRMRFSKSDNERGFVANSVWTVKDIKGDGVTLTDGKQTRTLTPTNDRAEQHIDLAYAVTVNGSQGASEPFSISLQGTEGARKQMVSFESAYVALSRMKQHAQVYTDNRENWITAMERSQARSTAHDILQPLNDRAIKNAARLMGTAKPLGDLAAGRAVLRVAGLNQNSTMARFISPGRKYPQPHLALPAFDHNGKPAGVWLSSLLPTDGQLRGLSNDGRVMGSEEAKFAGLQLSQNGESLLARDMGQAVQLARENPRSGVVVRLEEGEGRPWNPGAITGGRLWADGVPDNVSTGTQNEEKIPPEILEKQVLEEQQRREIEVRVGQTVRELARSGDRQSGDAEIVQDIVRDVDQAKNTDTKSIGLPESADVRERDAAVDRVVHENVLRERLQQSERDIVRHLERAKTLSGD